MYWKGSDKVYRQEITIDRIVKMPMGQDIKVVDEDGTMLVVVPAN